MRKGSKKGNSPKLFQQETVSGKAFISARPQSESTRRIRFFPTSPMISYNRVYFFLSNKQEVLSDLRSKPGEFWSGARRILLSLRYSDSLATHY